MSELTSLAPLRLQQIIEAALLAAAEPLSHAQLAALFTDEERPPAGEIGRALENLSAACAERGVELREVASGYRLQVKQELQPWVARLWAERPQRYSRAMLETLALVAYRQPITRGEIEQVRGVSLSPNIMRSLQEREWIRIVGHRDVPGKPALFGTTRAFLDYFNLKSLDELPTLAEIRDLENLEPEFDFDPSLESIAEAAIVAEADSDVEMPMAVVEADGIEAAEEVTGEFAEDEIAEVEIEEVAIEEVAIEEVAIEEVAPEEDGPEEVGHERARSPADDPASA